MKYKHILALDPSGNFHEGKGTTGWVLMNHKEKLIACGYISAEKYLCSEHYWNAILDLIIFNQEKYGDNLIIIMEDYLLYRNRAENQINSRMETCRLLGLIQWHCWRTKQPYSFQLAAVVKDRWSDELLLREHIFYEDRDGLHHTDSGLPMNIVHVRDAFKHATHYIVCRNNPKPKTKTATKLSYFENYSQEVNHNERPKYKNRPRKNTPITRTYGNH